MFSQKYSHVIGNKLKSQMLLEIWKVRLNIRCKPSVGEIIQGNPQKRRVMKDTSDCGY